MSPSAVFRRLLERGDTPNGMCATPSRALTVARSGECSACDGSGFSSPTSVSASSGHRLRTRGQRQLRANAWRQVLTPSLDPARREQAPPDGPRVVNEITAACESSERLARTQARLFQMGQEAQQVRGEQPHVTQRRSASQRAVTERHKRGGWHSGAGERRFRLRRQRSACAQRGSEAAAEVACQCVRPHRSNGWRVESPLERTFSSSCATASESLLARSSAAGSGPAEAARTSGTARPPARLARPQMQWTLSPAHASRPARALARSRAESGGGQRRAGPHLGIRGRAPGPRPTASGVRGSTRASRRVRHALS